MPLGCQNSSRGVCIIVYDEGFGERVVSEALTWKVDGMRALDPSHGAQVGTGQDQLHKS